MATHVERKKRLSGRLMHITRELEVWAAKRRLKKATERFTLTLTVRHGFPPDARPPKKEYQRAKPVSIVLGTEEWNLIHSAIRFSMADMPHTLVAFFKKRGNRLSTGKEIDSFLKLKRDDMRPFSPADTSFLNTLLRNAGVPCRLLVAGRKWRRPGKEKSYQFFVVEIS